ncbi:MAG: MFS transporter [Proteobacteria bacterium]|nr:MFS transporter [Pseudomonadota bacterium]
MGGFSHRCQLRIGAMSGWTPQHRHVVAASFLGWALDAFDYFLLVFVLTDIARDFNVPREHVALATMLTLAARPVGAFLFGRAADRYGRRRVLMLDVLLYSILGFSSGFAPTLTVLLVLRTLFGVAMGGEWGVGASLTMESVPPHSRGFVSGLLQAGYPAGYLLASILYGLLFTHIGWRGMFMVGALPALLVLYIRRHVPESPGWQPRVSSGGDTVNVLRRHWKLGLYAVVLMAAFNFYSHGTQDAYPTFLKDQHHLSPQHVSVIAVIYNIGAMLGGIFFGSLSERIGRRRAITIAALLTLPIIPLWALAGSPLWLAVGAFGIQFLVQGAWGVIPAHLNEMSPAEARGTFPGFVYQLGNLLASVNLPLQLALAGQLDGGIGAAMATVTAVVAVVIAVAVRFGPEARGGTLKAF